MALVNEIHIGGRVCTDPEQKGAGPTKFRIAHGGGTSNANKVYPTEFFSVICWSNTQAAQVLKGAQIELWGKLKDSTWTARDGVKHYSTTVVAETIQLVSDTGGTAAARAVLAPPTDQVRNQPTNSFTNAHGVEVSDADIPF
jgi:single-stranded DNA-binding protein